MHAPGETITGGGDIGDIETDRAGGDGTGGIEKDETGNEEIGKDGGKTNETTGGPVANWSDTSAFKSKDSDDGKTHTYFNAPGQGDQHGHVSESQTSDGQTQYHYARDNHGNVYIDDNPNSSTYTGYQTELPG
ncbi:MAG: hypothetical protein ACJ72N_02320 [Labedaea sp.]